MEFEKLEHVRTWEGESAFIGGEPFKLELRIQRRPETGYGFHDYLTYRFWHGSRLIFKGDDFRPSPMYGIDDDQTVAALLSFLSLTANSR